MLFLLVRWYPPQYGHRYQSMPNFAPDLMAAISLANLVLSEHMRCLRAVCRL